MCAGLIVDAMKAKPRKIQLWKRNGWRKFYYAIPIYPTVDSDVFDLILDDVEQCYWPMVLRRVLHDDEDFGDNYKSDEDAVEDVNEDAVEDVNEDAVKDVNEDANEDDVEDVNEDANEDDVDYEIKYRDRFDLKEMRMKMGFKPKKSYKEDDDDDDDDDEDDDDDDDDDEYYNPYF